VNLLITDLVVVDSIGVPAPNILFKINLHFSLKDQVLYPYKETDKTVTLYEGKSLNNRNFIITFLQEYLQKLFVSYFSTQSPPLRNTLGPPVHKLADAL
jgi:hypothetical protein